MNSNLIRLAIKKASQSICCYKISSIGLNKRGEILGSTTNKHGKSGKGKGKHSEIELIKRYGNKIKTIIICRIGNSGDILPIHCCKNCQKVIDKMGIKVLTVTENDK